MSFGLNSPMGAMGAKNLRDPGVASNGKEIDATIVRILRLRAKCRDCV